MEMTCNMPEAAVNVFSYVGTPSDSIGKDGDFYLEEETNLLYGPKSAGAWPENGMPVSGPVMRHKKRRRQPAWSAAPSSRPKQSLLSRFVASLARLREAFSYAFSVR